MQAGRLSLLASDEKGLAILVSPSSGHPFGNQLFSEGSIRTGTAGSTINLLPFPGLLDDHGLGERKLVLFLSALAEILTPQKVQEVMPKIRGKKSSAQNLRCAANKY